MLRLRFNPFFSYAQDRIESFLSLAEHGASLIADRARRARSFTR